MIGESSSVSAAADDLAGSYSAYARYSSTGIEELLAGVSELIDESSLVVDVGAGTGVPALALARLGHKVIALDISMSMLRRIPSPPQSKVIRLVGDAVALPLRSKATDLTIFVESLHLLPDLTACLREAQRVTKTGGHIAVIDTLREDLQRQVFHQYMPAFHALDSRRHFTLSQLVADALRLKAELVHIDTRDHELTFSSAASMTEFIASRPFFGLRQLHDDSFEKELEIFDAAIKRKFPSGRASSIGRETCIVFKVRAR